MEALTLQSSEKEWVIIIDKSQFPPDFVVKMLKRRRLEWLAKQADSDRNSRFISTRIKGAEIR